MAGVDYMEWGMDVEEWEHDDELPPPHLLADGDNEEEKEEFMERQLEQNISCNNKPQDDSGSGRVDDGEVGYPEMVQWRRRRIGSVAPSCYYADMLAKGEGEELGGKGKGKA
ncbi:hypothetical protein Gotur_035065 [Gossypium turneri]